MSKVTFRFFTALGKRTTLEVPSKYARARAMELAEEALVDKVFDVTYTVIIDGEEVTRELDYYNDFDLC